jgi:hypothetical protein
LKVKNSEERGGNNYSDSPRIIKALSGTLNNTQNEKALEHHNESLKPTYPTGKNLWSPIQLDYCDLRKEK